MTEPWPLPDGWRWMRFAEAAGVASDLVDPAEYLDLPHIAPNHIESQTGRLLPYTTIRNDGVTSPKHLFRPGQVLYSKIRPYLAKVVVVDFEGLCSADMYPIESDVVDARYLKWWMLHPQFTKLAAGEQARTVLPKINRRALDQLPVPVPPKDEQRRIVDILEDHLSRLDAANDYLDAVGRHVETLRAASLAELASPEDETVTLGELAIASGYGTSAKCEVDGSGPTVVRIPNVKDGTIDLTDEKRVADGGIRLDGLMLTPGDLLVVRTNGSRNLIGRTAVVPDGVNAAFASYLIRYVLDGARARPAWVHLMLERPAARHALEGLAASSAGQYNLGLKKLDTLTIPLPSIVEQDRRACAFQDSADQLRALDGSIDAARLRSAALRRALLAAAFTGQLTGRSSDLAIAEELAFS